MAIGETHVWFLTIDWESWQRLRWVYMRTLTADGWLWQDQGDSLRSLWQDHGDYTCGLWQLMVGFDKARAIEGEVSGKITVTIRADSDNWQCTLTRPGRQHEKPLTRPWQLYVRTLTADNWLWQDHGDSMRSLRQDHSDYCDIRPSVLTRQCNCTSSLFQTIHSADLAYLITPCRAQTLLLSPREYLFSTPKWRGKVEILP